VTTTAFLDGISIGNSPLILQGETPTASISVIGHFSDGVDRLVSASDLGTTYQSQAPEIVTVDTEGIVTAQSIGTAIIDVVNSGWEAQVLVIVNSLPWTLGMLNDDLSWNAVLGVVGYDVVRGNLDALRASAGDFSLATDLCVGDNMLTTSVSDGDTPAPGQGYFYLARVVYSSSGNVGSYDVVGTLRDDGISMSPSSCP
jgi:hypothetical protein